MPDDGRDHDHALGAQGFAPALEVACFGGLTDAELAAEVGRLAPYVNRSTLSGEGWTFAHASAASAAGIRALPEHAGAGGAPFVDDLGALAFVERQARQGSLPHLLALRAHHAAAELRRRASCR